jgi:hypothetical protein
MSIRVRTRDKDTLARFLGWFSLALGAAQLAAPRLLARVVGATDDGRGPTVMRAVGAREVATGAGILWRPRPAGFLWARVAGDAIDLALLASTAARTGRVGRAAIGIGAVAGVAAPDVLESLRLSRKGGSPRSGELVRKAVTIRKPGPDVESAWAGASEARRVVDEAGGSVRFLHAPGDRGTELVVEFEVDPRGGDFGRAAAKLGGKDPATRLADELRRFKQRVETGDLVRSDGSPGGHALAQHLKQRPARPQETGQREPIEVSR